MATLVSLDRNYLQKNVRQLLGQESIRERVRNVVLSPLDGLRTLSELAEHATRVGEFRRGVPKTPETRTKEQIRSAGFESREVTLDFGRIGVRAASVNRIVAFFNAQVQGIDKIRRSLKDHPIRTTARIIEGVTIPSLALYLLNRDEPGFDEVPQWQKDAFWLYTTTDKNGNVHWRRIPKPHELGYIFGSGVERLAERILEDDPTAFDDFLSVMLKGATPNFVPTAIAPIIEGYFNKSLFTQRPLFPMRRERFLPEFQYPTYTTELSKAIGRQIVKLPGLRRSRVASPAVIENLVRGWTGGVGFHLLNLADAAARKAGVLPDIPQPTDTMADIPFFKAFAVRHPSLGAESINQSLERYTEQQEFIDTIRGLARDGEPQASFEMLEIVGGTEAFVDVRTEREAIRNMSKMVRLITVNPEMPSDEKRQIIDELIFGMIDISKSGLEKLKRSEVLQ